MSFLTRIARKGLYAGGLASMVFAAIAASARPAEAQAQPVTAGYDKGFFVKSDNFEIHIGTHTQLQYSATRPDTFMYDSLLGREDDTKIDNELSIRRFKLFMTGFVYKP